MQKSVYNVKRIKGEIWVPKDKSISHRAAMLGAIAQGITEIEGFLMAQDCLSTLDCLEEMGADIQIVQTADKTHANVKIIGKGLHGLKKPSKPLFVGNSGTTIRLLAGILAGQNFETEITGDKSIVQRPMARIIEPLRLMGAQIGGLTKQDMAPLGIKGAKLKGINYTLPVPSAQTKSAILLAGLYADGKTVVNEQIKSRDHTEIMLRSFGADIQRKNDCITLYPGEKLDARSIKIPGDISSAAFFIVAASILSGSEIVVKSVGINPTRTGIIDVLKDMGACINIQNQTCTNGEQFADIYTRSASLRGVEIKAEVIPRIIDELPILAVAAAFADGVTTIKGAEELRVKESDRIEAICEGLSNLGADIKKTGDGFIIRGTGSLQGNKVRSFGDHRIAMSLAIAGLAASGQTQIDDVDCVKVSYPDFFESLSDLVE